MNVNSVQIAGATLFAIAVLHTFSVKRFQHIALKFEPGSIRENLFHWLGEVEAVFGLWACVLFVFMIAINGRNEAISYLDSLNFTEPLFVFVIMTVAATKPILSIAYFTIQRVSSLLPIAPVPARFFTALVVGPLLGSFITEPAAMTLTALIMKEHFFDKKIPLKIMYVALGTLFVNISIGGVLTPFAAPPIIMVASTWGWDLSFMLSTFGWKAVIAVVINALIALLISWNSLKNISDPNQKPTSTYSSPLWLMVCHVVFLVLIVAFSHHSTIFMGLFLFFLALTSITKEHQLELKIQESLLVAFFLAGLVVLGSMQSWWIAPWIEKLEALPLYISTTLATAVLDNAALTYLGTKVTGLSDSLKYALVAGSVTGGGLTVIANAPNPAGFSLLRDSFQEEGISPIALFGSALLPTGVAFFCFWFL